MHNTQLTTQDLSKSIVITTSLRIAESFTKEHKHVLRDIRELIEGLTEDEIDSPNFGHIFNPLYYVKESQYADSYGRLAPMYEMNREFFMHLVMGYTGKEARKIKTAFIAQFKTMEHELLIRKETRHIGKECRRELTDSIKEYVTGEGNFKNFAYSNYTGLIYKKALGMDKKKAKEVYGCKGDNLRDYLPIDKLEAVRQLESKIATFLEFTTTLGKTDKKVYKMVKEHLEATKSINA